MAQTPEGRVKDIIKAQLESLAPRGMWYFMPAMNGMGRSGVPDFIACISGRFIGIEAKATKGKATALQMKELGNIHGAGGIALIVTGETEAKNLAASIERLIK